MRLSLVICVHLSVFVGHCGVVGEPNRVESRRTQGESSSSVPVEVLRGLHGGAEQALPTHTSGYFPIRNTHFKINFFLIFSSWNCNVRVDDGRKTVVYCHLQRRVCGLYNSNR